MVKHASNPAEIQTPAHQKPDRPQHDRPAICVITQQYSSTFFVSLSFSSRKERFGMRFKKVIISDQLLS